MTDGTFPESRILRAPNLLTRVVVGVGTRLLAWQPSGALLIELPNGRRVTFGPGRSPDAVLILKNFRVIAKSIRRGALGFAEAYIDGDVECSDLVGLFRFVLRNMAALRRSGRLLFRNSVLDRFMHMSRRNTRAGSRRNIVEHYDLGNAFFEKWLDDDMIYSSALYAGGAATLEEAQEVKLRTILERLKIDPGMSVLEIGAGWGVLARRAARDRGARVTGITLSQEQYAYAQRRAEAEGLSESCRFRLQDYRDTEGQFDRLVSVEMIEAVGERHWPRYFQAVHDRLKPGGLAVIQAITITEDQFPAYRRSPDFIQRYIFPGGMLPTKTVVADFARRSSLHLQTLETFGPSYARTLQEWRRRFEAAWPEIAALGFDARFRRKWLYYLTYCEAGFLDGTIDVGLYRLTRPGKGVPEI